MLCCLVFATAASAESLKQADGEAEVPAVDAEATDESAAEQPDIVEEAPAEVETSIELTSPIVVPTVEAVPDAVRYRFLTRTEFRRFEEETGFDGMSYLACRDADDARNRQRLVTNRIQLDITLTSDGEVQVVYAGDDGDAAAAADADADDDDDGLSTQECVSETLEDAELEETPEDLKGTRYRYTFYDHNYYGRRSMRHAEVVALYTLSGASAGVAVGSFIAARNDDAEREEILSTVVEDSYEYDNVSNRALRFRRAGWSMVGLSVASFVGATALYSGNRNIEGRENPVLVLSPGSPTGDLGFTLSSQF